MTLANPEVNGIGNDTDLFIVTPLDTPSVDKDRYGDEFSNPPPKTPLKLKKPSNVETKVELNEDLTGYTVYEKIGDLDYRPVTELTFQEFAEWKREQMIRDYWDQKTDSLDKREEEEIKPPIWTFGKKGDPLVEIRPSGYVTLDFGARFQRTENPAIPVNQQKTGGFDFDQQISLNLSGKIGDRVKVEANWDTKAAFDFDNTIKISFEGKDTDIIREISAGNVSMPLNNSLIRGGQNLFGVKAKLQFGRLSVTTLLSNQRGKTETITVRNGAQFREYKLAASDYEEQRHFFLSHEFRERFAEAYRINPSSPTTGIKITRVEVYRTNIQANPENQRNVLALTDLGEKKVIYDNTKVFPASTLIDFPDNKSNNLLTLIKSDTLYRSADNVIGVMNAKGFKSGASYENVNGAVKLTEREFTFHPDLGYISLNSKLRDNEALAVSYEYTYKGENYKVGEMTEDYQGYNDRSVILLKLLKPQSINIKLNTWDLMMKNIYSLPTSNVSPENFQLRVIYRDDLTGIDSPTLQEGEGVAGVQLIELFGLDKINPNGTQFPDGNFDFLEDATINTKRGKIIFPHPEPYGQFFFDLFGNQFDLKDKYIYDDLYTQTKDMAKRNTAKDKFAITGFYQSSASADIMLPGINIAENSVVVQVGSITLSEGSDYTVDYRLGRVKINNEAILSSGKDIKVSYEKADVFSFRQKSLMGTRLDYAISENFNVGATMMHMSERPLITRVNIGDEPIKNTQIGLDLAYKDESRIVTKLVDKLPVIQTKEKSTVAINWEGAMLKPGTSGITGNGGTSYIDDFEGAESPVTLDGSVKNTWMISSTPDTSLYYNDADETDRKYTAHRAKIAVYNMLDLYNDQNDRFGLSDEQFTSLSNGEGNPYVRRFNTAEIFPNRQTVSASLLPQNTIDFAYYPDKRGPYNYNTNSGEIKADGTFVNPERNWGGLTRAITSDNDFQSRNIQFLEFWMLDPFLAGSENDPSLLEVLPDEYRNDPFTINDMGGDMYFNIGDISEDFMKDGRFAFENGLPDNVDSTAYGLVTTKQFLTDAFDNQEDRSVQDVGLDGLSNAEEAAFFGVSAQDAASIFGGDVSSDDFTYWDEGPDLSLLGRYMNANGLENNSPINSSGDLLRAVKTTPDKEDINRDQNINFTDSYYQFKLPLNRSSLNDNNPYVVGKVEQGGATWYQVRIPINEDTWSSIGNISGFQNIKFMRVFFTNFKKPIVVRMAQFQFVASQWLIANDNALNNAGAKIDDRPGDPNFKVSTVNIEENSSGTSNTSPYSLPPGTIRDYDQTTNTGIQTNEQSLKLCIDDLVPGEGRAVFKSINTPPLLNYGKLEMFVHAETVDPGVKNGDVTAFIRLGTDQYNNYYEIEVPLTFSDISSNNPDEIWREENKFDIALDDIVQVKVNRNALGKSFTETHFEYVGKYKVSVVGTPELTDIRNWLIGMRNPGVDGTNKSFCIWANELRATDFDQSVGYATTGSFSTNLADLGTLKATTRITTVGYGDIESKVFEREQANTVQWGVESNLAMDKFIPAKTGVKLPLYVSYDKTTVTPKYDPLNGDVELDESINSIQDEDARDDYEGKVKYEATIKSIQLQNVKKEKVKADAKKHIYDVENLTLGAGYTETKKSGMGGNDGFGNNLQSYLKQEYNGSAAWAYNTNVKSFEPFKKSKLLKSKHLALIKDFNLNLVPNSFSMRGDLRRTYSQTIFYVNPRIDERTLTPIYQKNFTFDRSYNMRWNITKSLSFTYSSVANALIDEPNGDRNGDNNISKQEYKDSVLTNLKRFGRLNNYQQDINLTYRLPLKKIPILDWIDADVAYKAGYTWRASILGLQDPDDLLYGNSISNSRNITVNGKLSLSRLYDKNKFLKSINSPSRRRTYKKPTPPVKKEGEEDAEEEKPKKELKGLKAGVRALMLVQDVNGKYTLTHSTGISGFLPTPRFLGFDDLNSNAPGSAFILGGQNLGDLDIVGGNGFKNLAVRNNWITRSTYLNDPITQSRTESYDLRSTIEPVKGFRIQLTANYKETANYSEVFRYNGTGYQSYNPVVNGNVDMSYIFIKTSFGEEGEGNFSKIFNTFEQNRSEVSNRLQETIISDGGYSNNSQDVLIPSFRAAYAGQDNPSLELAPKIPLPNWRVNYAGLSKWKPIKKHFSSFTITHGYTGTYEVGGYTSSLAYTDLDPSTSINQRRLDLDTNDIGSFISPFVISGVTLTEKFSPLIGFNVRTKSRINIRINYNISRILDLDMANLQVTEENSKDIVVGIGYTKRGMNLPFKTREREQVVLKNNVTVKMDVSIRDTRTVQRKVEGDQVVTAGNINFQLRPNISYEINKRVNLQLFYERTVNEPRISSSFKRSTTAFGVKLRFSLT